MKNQRILILFFVILIFVFSIAIYFSVFNLALKNLPYSGVPSYFPLEKKDCLPPVPCTDWSGVSTYISLVVTIFFGILTIFFAILIPIQLAKASAKASRYQTAVRLSEEFLRPDFHMSVRVPMWEIYVKWNFWLGPEADDYRRDVVRSQFTKNWSPFNNQDLATRNRVGNIIRFQKHNQPIDHRPYLAGGSNPSLSEHMILNIWIEYWSNVETLIAQGLADETTVRELLSENYSWYLSFMNDFRLIGEAFAASDSHVLDGIQKKQAWLDRIKSLEERFFPGLSPICSQLGQTAYFNSKDRIGPVYDSN